MVRSPNRMGWLPRPSALGTPGMERVDTVATLSYHRGSATPNATNRRHAAGRHDAPPTSPPRGRAGPGRSARPPLGPGPAAHPDRGHPRGDPPGLGVRVPEPDPHDPISNPQRSGPMTHD